MAMASIQRSCQLAVLSARSRIVSKRVLARAASSSSSSGPSQGPAGPRSTASSGSGSASASSGTSSSSSSSSSSSTSVDPRAKSTREWLIVGATGSVAVFGAYWYLHGWSQRPSPHTSLASAGTSGPQQQQRSFSFGRTAFLIPVHDPSDPKSKYTKLINMLTPEEVDARLRAGEASTTVDRPQGACLVGRYDTNSISSNNPIEDRRAEVIVERDEAVQGNKSDLGFFAVMDGHAGYHTSALLSQKLIAFVALELDKVIREAGEYGEIAKAKARIPKKLWDAVFGGSESSHASDSPSHSGGLDGDPEVIKRAIAKAFRGLDKEIVNRPVELLKEYELSRNAILASHKDDASDSSQGTRRLSSLAQSIFPQASSAKGGEVFTATQKSAYETMLPAMSGSCALLTYVDSARGDVYVACTGDSRAVAGWWDHDKQRWDVEPLSTDQTGRNLDEVKRMRSEHPASEAEQVIMRGRVLGGLEPTRAFGDARYKWDRSLQERLYDAFLPGGKKSVRGAPRGLQTPPYVTAEPVVEWRRLARQQSAGKELRFIIMATDGLWDMLSNEDAVSLVAAHLDGYRGTLDSSELQSRCFESKRPPALASTDDRAASSATASDASLSSASAPSSSTHPLSVDKLSRFVFEDENLATHLSRNALGGANRERVCSLLAIPAPDSRRYRDDITVNVLLFKPWHERHVSGAQGAGKTTRPHLAASNAEKSSKAKL